VRHVIVDNRTCTRSLALALALDLDLSHSHSHSISHTKARVHSRETHSSRKQAHTHVEHGSARSLDTSHSFAHRGRVFHLAHHTLRARSHSFTFVFTHLRSVYCMHRTSRARSHSLHIRSVYRMHLPTTVGCSVGLRCDGLSLIALLFGVRLKSSIHVSRHRRHHRRPFGTQTLSHSFSPRCHAVEGGEGWIRVLLMLSGAGYILCYFFQLFSLLHSYLLTFTCYFRLPCHTTGGPILGCGVLVRPMSRICQ